ncbi:MAG: hypothetical protein JRH19_02130 [Deltaproteobacteria bacterium]|nr:hypothetical protein [Deltaproteobacteria bacterium]
MPQGEVVENKRLSATLDFIKAQQHQRIKAKIAKPIRREPGDRRLKGARPDFW